MCLPVFYLKPVDDFYKIKNKINGDLLSKIAVYLLARLKGFEPLAHCLEGSCSIQLSYRRVYN